MKNIYTYISLLLIAVSCITNDLPYPATEAYIMGLEVEEAENVEINYDSRTVTVHFPETKDLRSVNITGVTFDKSNVSSSVELVGEHDLTSPLKFNVRVYHDYEWEIVAVREIERSLDLVGQVGSSEFDPINHRVIALVGKKSVLSRLQMTSLKLGPAGLTYYKILDQDTGEIIAEGGDDIVENLQALDFSGGLCVQVTAFDVTDIWTVFVEVSDISIQIKKVNPWTRHAYVTALGVANVKTDFKYRRLGDQQWIDIPEADVQVSGGTFVAEISGLLPLTEYEVIAVSGSDTTQATAFTTSQATQLPNASFEYASKVSGKDYYKFYDPNCGVAEGSYMFWGSGNGEGAEGVNGSANMGIIITVIDTDDKVDGNQSVCAQTSQMTGILAAGNLFTGQFAGLVGTEGGRVNFGRPWTTRPLALKIHCKYTTDKIDILKEVPPGVTLSRNDYDRAQIKVALGTWDYRKYGGTSDSPVHVNTTDPSTFVNYSSDPSTIANGDLILNHDGYDLNSAGKVTAVTSEWVEYTIPLVYHDINTVPTHIVISCASSQYGDYFTGCSTSKLWLDKLELVY